MNMNPHQQQQPLIAFMTPDGSYFYAPAYPQLQPQEGYYSPYPAPPPYTTGTTSPVYNPDMTSSYQTMSYPVAMTPDFSSVGSSTTEPTELIPSSVSQCVSGRSSVHSVPHQHNHMP